MGTWISHLQIAEIVLPELPHLDETAFTWGSLAPDSGVPNADWTVFDPPKEVTHFLRPGEGEDKSRDLDFYRQYLLAPESDPRRYSFLLGYFVHLLSDRLWGLRIGVPSKQLYAALFAEHGAEAWGMLKDDWYGLSLRFVRDHPDCLFWRVFMSAPDPPAYLPFLPAEATRHQFAHIRRFHSQPDPDWVLDRPYPYLNEATLSRYVDDTSRAILTILAAIDHSPDRLTDQSSALCLLPTEAKAPYPAPLGDPIH